MSARRGETRETHVWVVELITSYKHEPLDIAPCFHEVRNKLVYASPVVCSV
jgi:hypothetical protein